MHQTLQKNSKQQKSFCTKRYFLQKYFCRMHFRISTSAECTSTEVLLYQTPSQSLSNSLKTLEFCSNASVRCEQMDNNSKSQPLKNRKTKSNGLVVEDRISHLPDAILCHILSFTPTKYSIRTSVLSRRWEHLWALAHKFDLKLNSWFSFFYSTEEVKRFMELCYTFTHSINNLLSIRDRMHIEIFKIHFVGYFNFFRLHSSSWIATIVMFNVREVDLSIRDSNSDLGELPGCLFTCGTLVVLKLFGKFILNVPQRVCLPNLKTLRLESVLYLGDLSIHKLLSGCPLLEDMQILVHAHEPMPIQGVSHSSLKRFLFYSVPDDDPHTIVVDSPNLEFIDITNGLLSDISLNHFPNIVEAHININYLSGLHRINSGSAYKVFRMFQCIANVRRLFLSEKTLQFLDFAIPDLLPVFGNLVQLELCYNPFNGPILLMDLLHSSPKLEVLSFPGGIKFLRDDYNADDDDMNIDLDFRENDPERVPECLRQNLKIVEIKSFEGEEVELNIVKYLLKNGKLLEKMTITYWDPLPSVKFIWLQPELTDYPKLSTNCQLDLL